MDRVDEINVVINEFFKCSPTLALIPSKDLMPEFIKAGVFSKDHKNGRPIRDLLRDLDKANMLYRIPAVHAVRKLKNTYWYFSNTNNNHAQPVTVLPSAVMVRDNSSVTRSKMNSDEQYIIDLCDQILEMKGSRQHRFDFLVGDRSAAGRAAKLPVDVYYPILSLVIEYRESQHFNKNKFFDKTDIVTVSGVDRGRQRRLYDMRRERVLPGHGIELLIIPYTSFSYNSNGKIIRKSETDSNIVKRLLKNYKQNLSKTIIPG